MWAVAFSLGILGSLHCVGMCGPIAISFCAVDTQDKKNLFYKALSYNIGRTITYMVMGVFFGLFSSLVYVSGIQKFLSIASGFILIALFLFSVDMERQLLKLGFIQKCYSSVQILLSKLMSNGRKVHSFKIGLANGLLPCGLVYLALAGAVSTGSLIGGIAFMGIFGLGTLPMMFTLIMGSGWMKMGSRQLFRKVFPYATLAIGIFLIYRGIVVEMPVELDFWQAVKSPIMCH